MPSLILPLLLGCAPSATEEAPSPVELRVEVTAFLDQGGAPSAWTGEASLTRPPVGSPAPTRCVRRTPGLAPRVAGASSVRVQGPDGAVLRWSGETTGSPVSTLRGDPAWSAVTVDLELESEVVELGPAVRFGGRPQPAEAVRQADGGVQLTWPSGGDRVSGVFVEGPAGSLVCPAGEAGARIPWWAIPPDGGSVFLVTTRTQAVSLAPDLALRLGAAIARELRLDEASPRPPDLLSPLRAPKRPGAHPPRRARRVVG